MIFNGMKGMLPLPIIGVPGSFKSEIDFELRIISIKRLNSYTEQVKHNLKLTITYM